MKKVQVINIWKQLSKGKKVLSIILAAAVAGCGIGIPVGLKKTGKNGAAGQTMVQQVSASVSDISNSIVGSGSLETDLSDDVEIPSGIIVNEVKVDSGDTVKKGDVLATVDKTSVLEAMENVQEAIEEVDEELASVSATSSTTKSVKASVSGTIKKVYASKGEKAVSCIAEHGALVVITCSDGTTRSVTATGGTVSSIYVSAKDQVSAGDTLLTLKVSGTSAEYLKLQEERKALVKSLKQLSAMSLDGTITANKSGTIAAVNVSEAASASANTSSAQGTAAGSVSISASHTSADQTVASANVIQSAVYVQTTSVATQETESSEEPSQTQTEEEENDSNQKKEQKMQFQIKDSGTTTKDTLVVTPAKTGAVPQTKIKASDGSYTGAIEWNPSNSTFREDTVYKANVSLQAADGYMFSSDSIKGMESGLISGIQVSSDGKKLTFQITYSKTASTEKQEQSTKKEENTTQISTRNTTQNTAQENTQKQEDKENAGTNVSGSSAVSGKIENTQQAKQTATENQTVTGSQTSTGSGNSSNTSEEQKSDTDSDSSNSYADLIAAFSYASDDTMSLAVSVDELDINSVESGQTAEVTMDAIEGETYHATVTKISSEASSSSSGSAKYEVTLSVRKDENMKAGMSAAATIVVESKESAVTIPVSALQEKGSRVFVYTKKSSDGTLSGEQEVTTGISDGTKVEITDGLSEGDTVYYQKTGNISGNSAGSGGAKEQGKNGAMSQGGPGTDGNFERKNGNGDNRPQGAPGGNSQ